MKASYITCRYYCDDYGTKFKIISDSRVREYDVFEYGGNHEWHHIQTFSKFKWAYDFVKDCIDYE